MVSDADARARHETHRVLAQRAASASTRQGGREAVCTRARTVSIQIASETRRGRTGSTIQTARVEPDTHNTRGVDATRDSCGLHSSSWTALCTLRKEWIRGAVESACSPEYLACQRETSVVGAL